MTKYTINYFITLVCLFNLSLALFPNDNVLLYDSIDLASIGSWTGTYDSLNTSPTVDGVRSVRLKTNNNITRIIPTTGVSGISVTFAVGPNGVTKPKACYVDVTYDGSTFYPIWSANYAKSTDAGCCDLYIGLVYLPRDADNNPNFGVRLRADVTGTTACNYDNITVFYSNTPLSSGSVTPYNTSYGNLSGSGSVARSCLTFSELVYGSAPIQVINNSHFDVPVNASNPTNYFEGTITFINIDAQTTTTEIVQDNYTYWAVSTSYPAYKANYFNGYNSNLKLVADIGRSHLPSFSFNFVQDGSHFIPENMKNVRGTHQYWEYIIGPGRVWNEASDNGWSRVSLPFALTQRNAGCVHNGLMTFLFRTSPTVDISFVRFQITQETCNYFMFDMYGSISAKMTLQSVASSSTIRQNYETEIANRIPAVSMSSLPSGVNQSNLYPSSILKMTLYGVWIDNTYYRSDCLSRYDPYPFCDSFVVPSYSISKTLFVSLGAMLVSQKYTNATTGSMTGTLSGLGNFWNMKISDVFDLLSPSGPKPCGSGCAKAGCASWTSTTVGNVLDMSSGNYKMSTYMTDEDSSTTTTSFFLKETASDKITYSCSNVAATNSTYIAAYSYKASQGSTFVYHTTDHYLLATMLNLIVKNYTGQNLITFMNNELYKPLNMSTVSQLPRTTYDVGVAPEDSQPWGAWGMFFVPDDVIKISNFVNQNGGRLNGQQVLDYVTLRTALQRNPSSQGLPVDTGSTTSYKSGFWALDPWSCSSCTSPVGTNPNPSPPSSDLTTCLRKTAFASGYGGISVAFIPNNNSNYFYFSDGDVFSWYKAAENLLIYRPSCNANYAPCSAAFNGGSCTGSPLNVQGEVTVITPNEPTTINYSLTVTLLSIFGAISLIANIALVSYFGVVKCRQPVIFGDYFGSGTGKAEKRDSLSSMSTNVSLSNIDVDVNNVVTPRESNSESGGNDDVN
eukprot:TRINITY_DN2862_c0_g1_i1.p1 TRINITY_DN2862_c0_g1~~TRINITY_DN2862_c0_g1_i1.p1  ORF type:complete len:959 (-),score=234.39 TRINITY_DN2862_c0_g1_i1:18-2894(-)